MTDLIDHNASDSPGREQLLATALAEYHDRQSSGETVDIESFCSAYPDLAPELRRELETSAAIDSTLLPLEEADEDEDLEEIPERLSGHKILSEIGAGGMGRVFLAEDERLGRKVAIKTLNSRYRKNAKVRARFMQEAKALAKVRHPNVVQIYNLGQPDEEPHFVMEFVEGAPLTDTAKALTIQQKVELLEKVALAVDFLHQHQVIHRDLKPGNILVGSDLEPKILDFGLALQVDERGKRLSEIGEIMGTPNYFSPEHIREDVPLDAHSDIFSLGTVMYELLTGTVPFRGKTFSDQIRKISEEDPTLPRRVAPGIPGDLQNICLKALEKDPADRYESALEMARDLERFLADEPVVAAPSHYLRLMAGKIEQHVRELRSWRDDQILSESEFDALRRRYDRLVEREDAWIMEVRRLSLPQVALYLGSWILAVGAALLVFFRYAGLSGTAAVLMVVVATALTAYIGIRCWKQGRLRISVAYLLALCLLLPITLAVAMAEYGLFAEFTRGDEGLEFFAPFPSFRMTTNAQMWWSILISLPAYFWLRRFTGASVFSLVFAVMTAVLCLVTLLRMGLIEWMADDPGNVFFHLIPAALLFFVAGRVIERLRHESDSRYFYPIAVGFTFVALTGVVSFHEPYREWLESTAPWTRGRLEYLFMINAVIFLALQSTCERFRSAQMRAVASAFRFVVPGHILTSLWLLGMEATHLWEETRENVSLQQEARIFEVLLPCLACVFVLGSIPKQMKNYFATGMFFLAVGIIRLQQNWLKDHSLWPISLLVGGLLLMFAAANYSTVKMALFRLLRRWR